MTSEVTIICYLEGSEGQIKENLDVIHVFISRLHQVDEHHVVHPEQRDQQQGGLGQTSSGNHTDKGIKKINDMERHEIWCLEERPR